MVQKLLIANRGEIAVRIARTAAEMGLETVAVYSDDDARSLHTRRADTAIALGSSGIRAYLDMDRITAIAADAGCDALHPGYGFLSENSAFARQIEAAGIVFVGPTPESLSLFGNKVAAKRLARDCDVATIPGTAQAVSLEEARGFFADLPAGSSMMIKSVAGGGGRGMRAVFAVGDIDEAYARCQSEARAAFGDGQVYVERNIRRARHLEVQVLGDGAGGCLHLGERECSLQRRNQKIVEVAPSPSLDAQMRERLCDAALTMARHQNYRSLGTFEFLLDLDLNPENGLFFIEANPRIQVEHTVTEEIFDLDLVRLQLRIAAGETLSGIGFGARTLEPRGYAIQCRINTETMDSHGDARPSSGTLHAFDPPAGRGIRVDTCAYTGYTTASSFDPLLAKLIVHAPSAEYDHAMARARRALREFRVDGVRTNIPYLEALLGLPDVQANDVTTRFLEEHAAALAEAQNRTAQGLWFEVGGTDADRSLVPSPAQHAPDGAITLTAPMRATVVSLSVSEGETVESNRQLAILEAMKMEHPIVAPNSGTLLKSFASPGTTVSEGEVLFFLMPDGAQNDTELVHDAVDLDHIRPDLADYYERRGFGLDDNRPEAVAKRRARGQRTARENVASLCDEGSFREYGELAIAAQRRRRTLDDLIRNTSGDGVVTGIGTVNAADFGAAAARCAIVAYDYTVLAGTQGQMNHKKQDRLFGLAEKWKIPVILLAEGGGGRPGDTDHGGLTGLDYTTFAQFASLSGQVPVVGVASGRCFAGNAALLGCCDVVIATEDSNIGMAGPAMIEGGGLGVYRPEDIGPIDVQTSNGVVDLRVADEATACAVAKQYLSYFQGTRSDWTVPDQRRLRSVIPENRLRVYEVRDIIDTLADEGSVLELRQSFGFGIVTTLMRVEGRPVGLIANNTSHLGGAIDGPAADKAARFMQLCDGFGLPILSLVDTPGFMVGPEAEKTGLVRHVCRMFVTGANLKVPVLSIVLRKGYGLGAMAMTGGSFGSGVFTAAWPTGEFGGMGLEGAVRLGYRTELAAVEDPAEKKALFDRLVAKLYASGKATSIASVLEIDAVIDPAETRDWIVSGLRALPEDALSHRGHRPFIDTW